MPRYDRIYSTLASRAVAQGGIDVEAFVAQAVNAGMSPAVVQELLLRDLDTGGPIFGRFFRSLTGAAEATVMAAARQGEVAGTVAGSKSARRLSGLAATIGNVIEDANPAVLEDVERRVSTQRVRWVAELVKTCHLCIPLHNSVRTRGEWQSMGLHPDSIHSNEGWTSPCHCQLVPEVQIKNLDDLRDPLVRNKLVTEGGLKGSRRTARGVSAVDVDRARAARDKAMQTEEGRRTLRLLGQSAADTGGIEVELRS